MPSGGNRSHQRLHLKDGVTDLGEEGVDLGKLYDYDIILLIRGQETSEAEAAALKARVENEYPDAEVFLIEGLQPVYDYIMILE